MKKITLFSILIFINIFSLKSQDDVKNYKEPDASQGTNVIIGGDLRYDDYHNPIDPSFNIDARNANVNAFLNASRWKFTPKISYGIFISASGSYTYKKQIQDTSYKEINERTDINGTMYGAGDFYFSQKMFFSAAYEGKLSYYSRLIYSKQNPSILNSSFSSLGGSSTFWLSTGYGKILNAARTTKSFNFEKILKKEGLITSLSPQVKAKLTELIDKRNNKDYLSKYKDDNEIIFFKDVENLLLNEGVITKSLGAETLLRMYQVITNDKFLYYPKYKGFRGQLDLQLNPVDNGPAGNFLILSGIYGFPVFKNTMGVFAAFTALPLNKNIDGYDLFSAIRNPFSNTLPVTVEQFQLDKYNNDFYGNPMYDHRSDLINITGFKMHIFHTFNSFAGIILHGQYLYSKPRNLANFSELDAGFQIDYNVLSFIKLSGNVDLIKENTGFSSLVFSMGTTIIIF